MKKKTKYAGKLTIYTYVRLYQAAKLLVEMAEAEEEGNFYTSMMSVVATAFFLEAYLNHVGAELFPYWKQIERKLAPLDKLTMISHQLKLKPGPDMGKSPHQSFGKVFGFRNVMAHGKTETITGEWVGGEEGAAAFHHLKAKWDSLCTPEEARKCFDDGVEIVEQIHKAAGMGSAPFLVAGSGMSSSTG